MEYLRTLGSAAVSTLVQKSGLNLPFYLGTKVASVDGLYTLYDGTKRDDGSLVSIFEYELNDSAKKNAKPLAQNALRKLRTTRHPDILKFMDAVESDSVIYIMTERVRPLQPELSKWASKSAQEKEDWLLWGLYRISIALTFLNEACHSTHGKLTTSSIFISPSGEWKLGGLELTSNPKEENSVLYTMGGLFSGSSSWASPEVKQSGWPILKEFHPAVSDAYALGLLLHAVFNPSHPPPATAQPPHTPPSSASRGSIPQLVFPCYKKLLNPSPKSRMTAKDFLSVGMAETGFFVSNRLVKACLGLDNLTLSSEADKNLLLRTLKETASSFPPEFASYRILPSLLSALEFGGASAATILPLVLQFGANISPEEYPNVILTPLIKLYSSPDRGTRMALLEHLPEYGDKLDKKMVSEKIFPNLQTGFSDTVAVIREATVKSVILLAPKLSDRLLNNDLLRLLAKLQMDPEPSIRTNTCILIGRLGPSLGYNTKRKVLVPAFSRALKDTFVHARVAGLMAFMATIECFEIEEMAVKVIPNMSFTLVDKEKLVRDQAFKAIDLFLQKLESHVKSMPESELANANENKMDVAGPTTLVNSAAGAAGMLAGWAISSLGKKLATSDLQTAINGVSNQRADRPLSASKDNSPKNHIGELSTRPTSRATLPSPGISRPSTVPIVKPLKLTANNNISSVAALVEQLTEEVASEANPWGTDDLIDVNADDGDWSAFETAPTIIQPKPVLATHGGNLTVTSAVTAPRPLSNGPLGIDPRTRPSSLQNSKLSDSPGYNASPLSPSDFDSRPYADGPGREGNIIRQTPPLSGSPNVTNMTKEEKTAEMARRKEERKNVCDGMISSSSCST